MIKTTTTNYFLEFKTPFLIAHGMRHGTNVVYVKLECEGFNGYGEAVLPPYLLENQDSVKLFIEKLDFSKFNKDFVLNEVLDNVMASETGNYTAKAAVDIALHNLYGAIHNKTIAEIYGLAFPKNAFTTFTIGMASESEIADKMEEALNYRLLKVKLGGENDKAIITTIRKFTDKPLCVDVNQGWKSKEEALEMIQWLEKQNVIFVEQPLLKSDLEGHKWLKNINPLPIIADESIQNLEDLAKIADCFDGINVKLMKCGGVRAAYQLLVKAKELGLSTLIGCMSGSSCEVTAGANLASLADYLDLDGPLLIKNNPFKGINYKPNGDIKLVGLELVGEF